MAAAKKTPDLALLLSDEGEGEDPLADMLEEEAPAEGAELPPGFREAVEEADAAEVGSEERAQALYRMVEACKAAEG